MKHLAIPIPNSDYVYVLDIPELASDDPMTDKDKVILALHERVEVLENIIEQYAIKKDQIDLDIDE